jgi:Mn2+/Fe2+ NRAMP family transporter
MSTEVTKTPSSKKKPLILLILASAGPGIIAELAGNDAGAISTFSVAGAQYGLSMLWVVPVAMLFLMVVQEIAARTGAKTGKGFASLIWENFGLRLTAFAMLALAVANAGTTLAEFAGIAAGMELFGVSKYISVPIAGLAVWALLMGGSYRRTERIFLIISLVFLVYVVAALMSEPSWGEVALKTVAPSIKPDAGFISLVIAIIGTTIAPWMIFFGQSNVVEKGSTIKDLLFLRADVFMGAVIACMVVWFIMVTTGTVLPAQGAEILDATGAAQALAPSMGPLAEVLFGVGLVGASFLAACILPLVTSYAICEAFGWERTSSSSWSEAPLYKGIITGIIIIGCVIVLVPQVDLMGIMVISQVINGILLPILLVFLVLIANNRMVMGSYKNGKLSNVLSFTTIVAVIALTVALFVFQFLGYNVSL